MSFIWSLDLEALSVDSWGISFSFSLEAPPTGKVVEANSFSKFWDAAPGWGASATLFEEVPCGTSSHFVYSCWLDVGGFWSWTSSGDLVTGGAASFWPEVEPGARMAGGKKMFSGLLYSEEALIPAQLSASSQVWAQ